MTDTGRSTGMETSRAGDDNWYGIKDPRKRKQIQDRLAQRARRKRLVEAKKAGQRCEPTTSIDGHSANGHPRPNGLIPEIPRLPALYQTCVPAWSNPDACVQTSVSGSVFAALFTNGAMMGIACSFTVPSKSVPVGDEIPEPLRPTAMQLNTLHPLWFDRFPFPKMRDNMIGLMDIIDAEEFLGDLFCFTSFTVDPGAAPWDPKAWKIGKEFSAKWGFLFY